EGANEIALDAVGATIARQPVFLPSTVPAVPWNGWASGGYADARRKRSDTNLRAPYKETEAAGKAATAGGSMQPVLGSVNAQQAVPWTINQRVLGVMRACIERGIDVGDGLPRATDIEMPAHEKAWEDMSEPERRLWRYRASKVKDGNRALKAERLL